MSVQRQMKHLFWRFWWAAPGRFVFPGLYVATGRRNLRIIPIPGGRS